MKPTVINDNANTSNNSSTYSIPININQNQNVNEDNTQSHPGSHPGTHFEQQNIPGSAGSAGNSRRFPFYQPEFGFYDDYTDGFSSNLPKFRDPFFDNEEDGFFPTLRPPWMERTGFNRRQKPQPQYVNQGMEEEDDDGFFNYIPPEFRKYIPNNFQFPRMRSSFLRQQPPTPPTRTHFDHHPQFQQSPQPQSPGLHQQQQQQYPQYENEPNKPRFCDASIQTEDDHDQQSNENPQNLNQYGLRNTVDLGKIGDSNFEEKELARSRSAPPNQNQMTNENIPETQKTGVHPGNEGISTNSSQTTPNFYRQYYYPFDDRRQQHPSTASPRNYPPQQQYQPQTPPPVPPHHHQQQQPTSPNTAHHQYSQSPSNQQQFFTHPQQFHTQTQQQPQPQPQSHNQNQQDGGFVRNIPIVIESRKTPTKPTSGSAQSSPQPQKQPQRDFFQPQSPKTEQSQFHMEIPVKSENIEKSSSDAQAHHQQEQSQTDGQSQEKQQSQKPPTSGSISKIQQIQENVMGLMLAVEKFKGTRDSKEYLYLDEMLTRNLIKLDDIDTEGKDNIRLARKEAIKCIQASLCVLEMKADGRIPEEEKSENTEEQHEEQISNQDETKNTEDEKCKEIESEIIQNSVDDNKNECKDQTNEPENKCNETLSSEDNVQQKTENESEEKLEEINVESNNNETADNKPKKKKVIKKVKKEKKADESDGNKNESEENKECKEETNEEIDSKSQSEQPES